MQTQGNTSEHIADFHTQQLAALPVTDVTEALIYHLFTVTGLSSDVSAMHNIKDMQRALIIDLV
jgi:hypothetical protein